MPYLDRKMERLDALVIELKDLARRGCISKALYEIHRSDSIAVFRRVEGLLCEVELLIERAERDLEDHGGKYSGLDGNCCSADSG